MKDEHPQNMVTFSRKERCTCNYSQLMLLEIKSQMYIFYLPIFLDYV